MVDNNKSANTLNNKLNNLGLRPMDITRYSIRNNEDLFDEFISTGFAALDKAIGGGLPAGQLCTIGAVSSAGKTTLLHQIATNLATRDIPTIFVSLEMTRKQLEDKLISRYTYLNNNFDESKGVTVTEITNKEKHLKLSDERWQQIYNSSVSARDICNKFYVLDKKTRGITVEYLDKLISAFVGEYHVKPVLMIDYLQILKVSNQEGNMSDKKLIDFKMDELSYLASKYNIPIVVISSLSRSSYNVPITGESFKESGAIEYGSDILLGLQYKGVGEKDFDFNKAKKEFPRKLELVVLKNRNGSSDTVIDFNFYAKFNCFIENEDFNPIKKGDYIYTSIDNYIF